ncbi:hypothetical protein EDD85DRAFT_792749 [Armillaria nabsnona]|nr:hypothetical protein EDD85DRAFT_792749 [Armillaria nabsnona]
MLALGGDGRFGGRCKERMTGDGTDKLASTSNVRLNSAPSETAISDDSDGQIDLVGGPFAVIRQAHSTSTHTHYAGVFISLTRKLGVKHLEIVEVYDIEPWAVDHLHPFQGTKRDWGNHPQALYATLKRARWSVGNGGRGMQYLNQGNPQWMQTHGTIVIGTRS